VIERVSTSRGEWIGAKPSSGFIVGPLLEELESLPSNVEVAVVDDLVPAPRRHRWRSGPWLNRFSFPFRNPSVLARGDFRGNVYLKVTSNPTSETWWLEEARKRLSSADTIIATLPKTFRATLPRGLAPAPAPWQAAKSLRVSICYRDRSDLTCALLSDLGEQNFTAESIELVLVDNQSQPKESKKVLVAARALPSRFRVIPIAYDRPYNHSAQNNLAVADSTAEVFVFLNNDARLKSPDVIQCLADYALEPDVATVGPRIVGEHGLVSAGVQIYPRAEGVSLCESPCPIFSRDLRETSGNSFACAAVSARVFRELKGLDETDFPSQYNDADFFLRASERGYRHLMLGTKEVFHQPGQTESSERDEVVKESYRRLLMRYPSLERYLGVDPRMERISAQLPLPGWAGFFHALFRGWAGVVDKVRA